MKMKKINVVNVYIIYLNHCIMIQYYRKIIMKKIEKLKTNEKSMKIKFRYMDILERK